MFHNERETEAETEMETETESELHRQLSSAARAASLLGDLQRASSGSSDSDEQQAVRVQQLCSHLLRLARTARSAGLSTFCSLTLHALEQLRPTMSGHFASARIIGALQEWLELSEKYLRNPDLPAAARALVCNLGDRRWDRPVCETHRQALLAGLRQEGALFWECRRRPAPAEPTDCWRPARSSRAAS